MDRKVISVLCAGVVVVLGLIASALGVAGITNISAARIFLVVAWAAAVMTVTTAEAFAARSIKNVMGWGVIIALVAGAILFGIDRWMIGKKNEKEPLTLLGDVVGWGVVNGQALTESSASAKR